MVSSSRSTSEVVIAGKPPTNAVGAPVQAISGIHPSTYGGFGMFWTYSRGINALIFMQTSQSYVHYLQIFLSQHDMEDANQHCAELPLPNPGSFDLYFSMFTCFKANCFQHVGFTVLPSGKHTKKTMENHHFQWVNPRTKWQFAIAMLNYQRVKFFQLQPSFLFLSFCLWQQIDHHPKPISYPILS